MLTATRKRSTKSQQRRGIVCDGSFDIETWQWDKFVCGGISAHGNKLISWDEDELVEYMLNLAYADSPTVLYSHNGGRYDDLWFLKCLVEMGFPDCEIGLALAGGRVVKVELGALTLLDSAALVPFRLEKAAGLGGAEKVETDLPCVCSGKVYPEWWPKWAKRGCGGYCSIRPDMSRAHRKRLEWYLDHDVDAVPAMLDGLETFAAAHDMDLSVTLGSSMWRTARRRLGLPDADWRVDGLRDSSVYRFVRDAYYGGRCQVGRPQAERVFNYDITSAYPFALSRVELPIGTAHEYSGGAKQFAAGMDGVYTATVLIPSTMHVPPLPTRVCNGAGTPTRIAYPTGEVTAAWCGNELRAAVEAGARIVSIGQSIVWDESAVLFGEWLSEVGELRAGFKRGEKAARERDDDKERRRCAAFAEFLKWAPNSVTGKLAQHPETEVIVMNPSEMALGCPADAKCQGVMCSPSIGCCAHRCYGTCSGRGLLPLGNPHMRIYTRDEYKLTGNMHVVWAGYLTGATRVQWRVQAVDDGDDGRTWCYGDTDSIKATAERTKDIDVDEVGSIGLWKFEGTWREWDCLGPKTYSGIDEATGEFIARSKGIVDAARNFDTLKRGDEVVMDRGVQTFKTAARGDSLFCRKRIARRIHAVTCRDCGRRHYGDRILGDDGLTHPQDADAYHDMKA